MESDNHAPVENHIVKEAVGVFPQVFSDIAVDDAQFFSRTPADRRLVRFTPPDPGIFLPDRRIHEIPVAASEIRDLRRGGHDTGDVR